MGRLLQFFYRANGPWRVFQQLSLSTSDAGILGNPAVSGNSRDFSVFARGIDGRLLRLTAPHELSTFLPYTSDTRRKK
jgi:hypothetical protein